MTGQELVELLMGCSAQKLEEISRQPRNAVVGQVSGNVIQVNFSARAASSWNRRKAYQAPSKRLQVANRASLTPTTVPSASPSANSVAVPSTSLDTGIPYSSC
ncbi:hypothetical protein D3C76_1605390 [compost metagenome]